ncbi:MAG TPA: heme exporter protein CcmD [Gammaproteobacteria bacterium]|nr:heme exporter protein CcmD [Gammaproteobacteria bacterium]
MTQFLAMGGYAAYVWTAYGITLLVLVLNVAAARRSHRGALRRARELAGRETSRKQATVRQLR